MALNWQSVKPEHVRQACDTIVASGGRRKPNVKGLFVKYKGQELPAKAVLSAAYRIANGLESDSRLRFSSGEGTINRLRALGFDAGRVATSESGIE